MQREVSQLCSSLVCSLWQYTCAPLETSYLTANFFQHVTVHTPFFFWPHQPNPSEWQDLSSYPMLYKQRTYQMTTPLMLPHLCLRLEICRHKLYHLSVANLILPQCVSGAVKSLFAAVRWYNLCPQIIQTQSGKPCYHHILIHSAKHFFMQGIFVTLPYMSYC